MIRQFLANWRYYWRRYLGLLPLQFCMICGRAYWGGLPWISWHRVNGRLRPQWQWLPWWSDYCSKQCCDEDLDSLPWHLTPKAHNGPV